MSTGEEWPYQASALIDASPQAVRAVLLDPLTLAQWNPAFRSITGPATAVVGERYPITVLGGLAGHFRYDRIDGHRIDTAWQVPGFRETGTWVLRPYDSRTVVTHAFTKTGALAKLLGTALRDVAGLRLERLARRVSTPTQRIVRPAA